MGVKWIPTAFSGVRYYESKTRKHGIQWDRYFAIRYQKDGKRVEEGLGWGSDGWRAEKAALQLAELKKAAQMGEGPERLVEKRALAEKIRQEKEARDRAEAIKQITFSEFWVDVYRPAAESIKRPASFCKEEEHVRLWLRPAFGERPLREITPLDIRRVRSNMQKAGRSPRSVQYCLATFRQIWNMARREKIVVGDHPGKGERLPHFDNARVRFLSQEEATQLLSALKEISVHVHDQALLSLHCGLRFGETAALTWGCVDFEQKTLFIKDTKSGRSRHVFMTDEVCEMLNTRYKGQGAETLLFTDKRHKDIQGKVSNIFPKTVKELGFNDGITDPRQKVCFHSLRHSFCSWLVQAGTPLYTVARLAGHQTLAMSERYSHLAPDTLRSAVTVLNGTLTPKEKIIPFPKKL